MSVLMTAYNREMFIGEAIESVLEQTYHHFELIIVDDSSNDKTNEIIKKYAESDKRIKYFVNKENLGDYPNRNKAASFATGDYIMYVDSDDSIQSNAIEYIINSFAMFPNASHSAIYYHDDLIVPTLLNSAEAIENHFFKNNSLSGGPGARVFKKQYFDSLGGYPEKYGPANDMYFNILTTSKSPILMLPYLYLNYRIHPSQESNNKESYIYNNYNYLNDVIDSVKMPLSDSNIKRLIKGNKRRFVLNLFNYYLKEGSLTSVLRILKNSKFKLEDIFKME